MIILHGASISPFVRKVVVALALKELPYEHIKRMPFTKDPQFRKISPLEKVPALQDGDLAIADSKVICRYLENAYPAMPIYPGAPAARARADWFEEYGATVLAASAATIFFQRVARPMMFKEEPDEEAVTEIINEKLPPALDYLEGELAADGFLFADFGIADFALVSPFVNAAYAGYTIDPGRWPKFAAFVERVQSHPVVAPLLAREAAAFGKK